MKTFIQKNLIASIIGAVVVVVAVGSIWYVAVNHAPSFSVDAATRGDVVASLDEPGTVAAENNVNLSFQAGGQIAGVYVQEGDTVSAGAVLAGLSSASLQANLEQANAAVAAAQANLDGLQTGTRPEQLTIDQNTVTNAQSVLAVDDGNAYTSADDAIRNQTDNLFTNPENSDVFFLVPTNNSQLTIQIQNSRIAIQTTLNNWYISLSASSSDPTAISTTANAALTQIQSYLDSLALAVNGATPASSNLSATTLAGYKTDIVTARAEVGAAITTLTGAESTLETAQDQLELAQAGSTPQAIEAGQASVSQAESAQALAQVALSNASLIAPFSGTVQNLTAQVGQVVSPGAPVLSLVNNSGLKITAYASEADVAKIKQGDAAQITLDAFGTTTVFPATVSTVDTAETQVNGTPAYLVTLHFTNPESQVKDGMTGNVHIVLAEDDNVVEVPSRLVINNNNQYFVLVQTSSGTEERQVQVGLTGDNGMTEITSGINVGDKLANF